MPVIEKMVSSDSVDERYGTWCLYQRAIEEKKLPVLMKTQPINKWVRLDAEVEILLLRTNQKDAFPASIHD
jgi:hypothetical protein